MYTDKYQGSKEDIKVLLVVQSLATIRKGGGTEKRKCVCEKWFCSAEGVLASYFLSYSKTISKTVTRFLSHEFWNVLVKRWMDGYHLNMMCILFAQRNKSSLSRRVSSVKILTLFSFTVYWDYFLSLQLKWN